MISALGQVLVTNIQELIPSSHKQTRTYIVDSARKGQQGHVTKSSLIGACEATRSLMIGVSMVPGNCRGGMLKALWSGHGKIMVVCGFMTWDSEWAMATTLANCSSSFLQQAFPLLFKV